MLLLFSELTASQVRIVRVIHPLNIWWFTVSFGLQPGHTCMHMLYTRSQTTPKHAHTPFLAGSVTVPHLHFFPGVGIRPFLLMNLSLKLTVRHKAVLVSPTLLPSVVLVFVFFTFFFFSALWLFFLSRPTLSQLVMFLLSSSQIYSSLTSMSLLLAPLSTITLQPLHKARWRFGGL